MGQHIQPQFPFVQSCCQHIIIVVFGSKPMAEEYFSASFKNFSRTISQKGIPSSASILSLSMAISALASSNILSHEPPYRLQNISDRLPLVSDPVFPFLFSYDHTDKHRFFSLMLILTLSVFHVGGFPLYHSKSAVYQHIIYPLRCSPRFGPVNSGRKAFWIQNHQIRIIAFRQSSPIFKS